LLSDVYVNMGNVGIKAYERESTELVNKAKVVRTQRIMLAYLLLIRINNVDAHGSSRPLRESGYILNKQEL